MAKSYREECLEELQALRSEGSTWIEHWRELNDWIRPRRARFTPSERNKGIKRNGNIINGTATYSLRTLAAGMQSGITSPARRWFRLTTPDPDLAESGAVREWLDVAQDRLFAAFAKSNLYTVLHSVYEQLGLFGTACFNLEEDFHSIMRGYVFPVGQFWLANGPRQDVEVCYREFGMTVRQLVEKFGLEACSKKVQDAWERHNRNQWIEVVHHMAPNTDYTPGRAGRQGWKYLSTWLEREHDKDDALLYQGGFRLKPFCAPRWIATAEDVYGESPAMDALGACKAIQLMERRKAQASDKMVNPPMKANSSLQHQRVSMLPGDVTYVDGLSSREAFSPAYEVNPSAVSEARQAIREEEAAIKQCMYADVWLMFLNGQDDPQKTATEIAALKEEKMLILGPVMERLSDELLDPIIDLGFDFLQRRRLLPPPPKELQGKHVAVEYISVMAQAQKNLEVSSRERLVGFVGRIAAVRPDVLDKVDWDKAVEGYADDLGVKANLVLPEDQVQAIRQAREQQKAQQAAMQQSMAAVQGAKTLSEVNTGGDNGLTRILGALPPVANAQAGGGGQ